MFATARPSKRFIILEGTLSIPTDQRTFLTGNLQINSFLAFVFGIFFISVLLVFAVLFPNPTAFQQKVFITVLSLAAGGIGAILPGFIEIRHRGVVRAGGAFALAIGVYAFEPAITKAAANLSEPKMPAEPVASTFLKSIDAGETSEAWRQLDPGAIGTSIDNFDNWERMYNAYVKPLGNPLQRELVGMNTATSPSGAPAGIYRAFTYRTKFSKTNNCRGEQVVLRASPNETWRVYSYNLSPNSIEC